MNAGYINTKYLIGDIIIVVLVIFWASILVQFPSTVLGQIYVIFVSIIQGIIGSFGLRYFFIKPEELEIKKLLCTVPVEAMLVGFKPVGLSGTIASYDNERNSSNYAIYVFEWDGEEKKVTSDLPYRGAYRKNLPSEILVNPKNPDEIDEPQIERSRLAHYRFLGTMLVFWAFASFFFLFGGE